VGALVSVDDTEVEASPPPGVAAPPSAAALDTLSRSDQERSQLVPVLAAALGVLALTLSMIIEGNAIARLVMIAGLLVVIAANVWVRVTAKHAGLTSSSAPAIAWVLCVFGTLAILPFTGVLSGGVIAPFLVVTLVAQGQSRNAAIATLATAVPGHIALVVLVRAGALPDVGLMPIPDVGAKDLVIAEMLIAAVFLLGAGIGRWARRNTLVAYEELERRARAAGHEEAMEEVRDLARVMGAGKLGRYSEQRLGPFVVGQIIGRGAMGEVYEAERVGGGPPVAIKVLHEDAAADPQRLARFEREARAISAIDSRHVVGVVEIGAAPVPYLAMDRLVGTDLGALLRERRTLPYDELLRLVDDVARGLDAARRAHIVHRDIKPPNLFLERDSGRWKILDFGVSRLAGIDGTLTGDRVVGTPAYMAPEQVTGEPITHATDVYGLAAVAYRCLTGRPPYSGSNINELLYKVVHARPRRPTDLATVPVAVDDVLKIGLARHARDRYLTAPDFSAALAAALRGAT
jgi:hypothetical protein